MPTVTTPLHGALVAALLSGSALVRAYAVDGTGLTGTYFHERDFAGASLTRVDPAIDFTWDVSKPIMAGIGPTYFSVLWTGQVLAQRSEKYTFSFASDDGGSVELGGTEIIANWGIHGSSEVSATATLTAGTKYSIRVKYFQWSGGGSAKLSWSSASTPKAVIPTACLFPDGAQTPFAVSSAIASRTSPAWLEGTVGEAATALSGTISGHATALTRESPKAWYLAESGVSPAGIALAPGTPVHVDLTEGAGSTARKLASDLSWQVTDLANLPYGLTTLAIRKGESLLLTSGKKGKALQIDTAFAGTFHAVHTGVPGQDFPTAFPAAGSFDVRALVDGLDAGRLQVVVVSADLQGPIACEGGYQRIKDVAVAPLVGGPDHVVFTANDADWLRVGVKQRIDTGVRLNLLPFSPGNRVLEARLGDAHGPLLARQAVDTFTMHTTAETIVPIVAFLPDGSKEALVKLTVAPLFPNLDIRMNVIVAGVTFDDSTTVRNVSTNAFTKVAGGGQYLYEMIRTPTGWPHFCHTIVFTQAGVQINQPR